MTDEDKQRTQVLTAIQTPIGEAVKRWRQFRGISLTGLANRAGMTKGYLSQVEHNKISRPSDEYLGRLADALSIEVESLLARQMPPSTQAANLLHGAGIYSSPIVLSQRSREQDNEVDETVAEIIAEFNLPIGERELAEQLVLEATRSICRVIKQRLEKEGTDEQR